MGLQQSSGTLRNRIWVWIKGIDTERPSRVECEGLPVTMPRRFQEARMSTEYVRVREVCQSRRLRSTEKESLVSVPNTVQA